MTHPDDDEWEYNPYFGCMMKKWDPSERFKSACRQYLEFEAMTEHDDPPSAKNLENVGRDTQGEDCGIYPLQIRGWPKLACRWHDSAYIEKSWHQSNMTRANVDRAFLTQLLNLSGSNIAKRIASYGMYYVARLFGARFWEGKK